MTLPVAAGRILTIADHFEAFLLDEVDLNKSRIDTLVKRVETIQTFVGKSDWVQKIIRFSPQGSWAHKTIIKPPGDAGFDADLLAIVSPVAGWTAKQYVLDLRRVFLASDVYKDITVLGNRCVTLDYKGDFSLDVVPYVSGRPGGSKFEVCNRTDDKFEATDSEAFTAWLNDRNTWAGNDYLRKVLRLLKYLRDVKMTFSCKSILLTTLVAGHVDQVDTLYRQTYFKDVPTSLKTLVDRLDLYLQARPKLHRISNPVLPAEDFVRHWDEDKYANFREMIHKYKGWIDDAYSTANVTESVSKWRKVFGDDFAPDVDLDKASETQVTLPALVGNGRFRDAVEAVRQAGTALLSLVPKTLPWVNAAPFRFLPANATVGISIRASEYTGRDGKEVGPIGNGHIIGKGKRLLFEAVGPNGIAFPKNEFEVQWRVVNTDREARSERGLRGGFYRSQNPGRRRESTQYRGVHWVEAFVLRKRDRTCIGQSDRFYVVIE